MAFSRLRVAGVVMGISLGCGAAPQAPTRAGAPAGGLDAGSEPDPSAARATSVPLCGTPGPCRVCSERSAGRDAQGHALSVATIYRGHRDDETGDAAPAEANEANEANEDPCAAGLDDDGADEITKRSEGTSNCRSYDYVLLTRERGVVVSARLLSTACNDGHGAAGVGEDRTSVEPGRFVHEVSGGSSWRWSQKHTIGLAPLRLLEDRSEGTWSLGTNREETSFRWEEFGGELAWYSPPCTTTGEPDTDAPEPSELPYRALWIPEVAAPPGFATTFLRSAGLGRCAAGVDASGRTGFLVFGEAGTPADAAFRVVAVDARTLLVEIDDDRWVGPSARWLVDDHLELWLAPSGHSYYDHCIPRASSGASQWGIRVVDGRVFSGAGSPPVDALRVETSGPEGHRAKLVLHLPEGRDALTVVYSDGDDGKKQERLLATSKLVFRSLPTLGRRRLIEPSRATCIVRDGKLEPELRLPAGTKPLVGGS